ncbi:MAG: hypothetical protein GWN87_10600 [Desulfuromonadales bacterium]|nr:hypothetical protein [Desulfuromonadales bacterium]NIS40914.1 hypothetical protein [Desulfuromonadales bacterium]
MTGLFRLPWGARSCSLRQRGRVHRRRGRAWLHRIGETTLFVEPDSSWQNGHSDSFSGKLRGELLDGVPAPETIRPERTVPTCAMLPPARQGADQRPSLDMRV